MVAGRTMNVTEWAISRGLALLLVFFGVAAIDVPQNPAIHLLHQVLDELRASLRVLPIDVF